MESEFHAYVFFIPCLGNSDFLSIRADFLAGACGLLGKK